MAIYRCCECESHMDDDYHPCQERPRNETGLCCPECYETLQGEAGEAVNGEDYPTKSRYGRFQARREL